MKLDLYMFDTCPFCRRVLGEISKSGRTNGRRLLQMPWPVFSLGHQRHIAP